MTVDLHKLAQTVIKKAEKKGADVSEVVFLKGKQMIIELEQSSIVKANNKSISGIGLRLLLDKAVAIGSSTQFDDNSIDGMVKDTVALAKSSSPDPAIVDLAKKAEKYPKVEGLYNKKLANLQSAELVELAIEGLDASLARDENVNVNGRVTLTVGEKLILNSNGVDVHTKESTMNCYFSNKITKNDDVGVSYDYGFGRKLDDIDFARLGKKTTDKAFKNLGGKKITTGEYPFILDERATRQTLNVILNRGISAYQIDQGTAFFSDRLGEVIAGEKLTVYDQPLENGGINSRVFDDEGTSCKKIKIIEDGTLLTYLSDVYTSHKMDIPNTGSATKQGYAGIPHPELAQIQVAPGDASEDELFAELDTGLYIENPLFSISGTNISQQIDVGFWVENGEKQFPVKNTMLGTTIYDLLMNINLIGKDILNETGLKSPKIQFKPTKFSSGK
jgi:PmbA protein